MPQCLKKPALEKIFFFFLKREQQPMRRCYQMWKYGNVEFQHITKIEFCCNLLKILRYWNEKKNLKINVWRRKIRDINKILKLLCQFSFTLLIIFSRASTQPLCHKRLLNLHCCVLEKWHKLDFGCIDVK